ncbi:PAS domain S-box protein [Methanospirillum sp.]
MFSVLYIDDDTPLLEIGKVFLERSGFLHVQTVISGKNALELLQKESFDVIISDYEMPEMDGLQLLKEVRSRYPRIPFIIFTGRGREEVVIEALNSGASFYLQKGGDPTSQFAELIHMAEKAITHFQATSELEKKNEELSSLNEELASIEEELRQNLYEMNIQSKILHESEERYRLVMEATSDGIWDLDLKSKKAFFSDWYYKMIGYEPGEFEGSYDNWRTLVHPDDISRAESEVSYSITHPGAEFNVEFRIKTKQGFYRWIHGRGRVVSWDSDGNAVRMVGSHIDITDRKRIEDALLVSEEKYRILADKSRDLIFLLKIPEIIYEYISPSVKNLTGYSQDEFYQSPELLKHCIAPSFQDFFEKAFDDLIQGNIPDEYEFQIITKSGEIKWVNQRNTPIYDDGNRLTGLQGIVTDITERKMNEEIIREAMKKYEILFNNVPSGIVVTDESGKIIEANQDAAKILQVTRDELITRGITRPEWSIFSQDGTPIINDDSSIITNLKVGRGLSGIELGVQNPYGHLAWIVATSSNLNIKGYGSIISFQDIGEQKRTSQALSMVNKKLSLLTSITRHDVKNSLTALKGFLYLLSENMKDAGDKELVQKITSIAGDITRKIDFTSAYQKIGAENPEWQNLSAIIGSISLNGVQFSHDVSGIEIFADQMLGIVFENLIQNSVMHGEIVTHIDLKIVNDGQNLVLVFEDNGVGIPSSEKEMIFERGYGKNTGFGLFLIREILAITGLSIKENGIPGKGVRFEITVPQGVYRTIME